MVWGGCGSDTDRGKVLTHGVLRSVQSFRPGGRGTLVVISLACSSLFCWDMTLVAGDDKCGVWAVCSTLVTGVCRCYTGTSVSRQGYTIFSGGGKW